LQSRRRAIAAGVGAYVGLNVAALFAAIEFGIQPVLFHTANGTPLYSPFHLSQTIPAMLLAHLTVAGAVELALTVGVMTYLQRANLPLLRMNNHEGHGSAGSDAEPSPRRRVRAAVLLFGAGALLTPVGLLARGTAFGEDAPANLDLHKYHLQAVPDGLARYAGFWHHALFAGYDFNHDAHPVFGYLVSAALGMLVIAGLAFTLMSLISRLRSSPR